MIEYYFGLPFDWSAFWTVIIVGLGSFVIYIGSMYAGINPYGRMKE